MACIVLLVSLACPKLFAAEGSVEKRVEYYSDKKMAAETFFQNGRKVGVHRTWYLSGNLKSRSEFEKPNQMKLYQSWFENGKMSKQIVFKDGLETDTKIYRESGQIYLNRVVRNGRMYGLPGGKACTRVKSDDL